MRGRVSAGVLAAACRAALPCFGQCGLEPFETSQLDGRAVWVTLYPTTDPVPGVYMSGTFRVNGVRTGLVKRVNGAWVPVLGAPESLGAMTQHVDERGSALVVASDATLSCLPETWPSVYRFDGTSWELLPPFPEPQNPPFRVTGQTHVDALASFDPDGAGPLPAKLYAARQFAYLVDGGSDLTSEVIRLDPPGWSHVGFAGLRAQLMVYDPDGPGPELPGLYSLGRGAFYDPNNPFSRHGVLQRLDPLPHIVASMDYPDCMAVYDLDGAGPLRPMLAVGGDFVDVTDGVSTVLAAPHVVTFDGAQLSVPGQGLPAEVQALAHFDADGSGPERPRLIAAGRFTVAQGAAGDGLVAWDGTSWSPFAGGMLGDASVLRAFDEDASGPRRPELAWSGAARLAGRAAPPTAVLGEQGWQGLFEGPGGPVRAITQFGGSLIVGGRFDWCGDLQVNNIAKWTGQSWAPLGTGLGPTASNPVPQVFALTVHDDGRGPAMYVGGSFQLAGGNAASNIARWNGSAWERVGQSGLSGGAVLALASHDPDGSGPLAARLYAGGTFTLADGAAAVRLAFWDGQLWTAVPATAGALGSVRALKSWDDGTGPALFVGGDQLPEGSTRLVWKLTIAGWQGLPFTTGYEPGATRRVNALEVHDDGTGAKLYAAGRMTVPEAHVVKVLQGGSWVNVLRAARGFDEAWSLRSIPRAGGSELLADHVVIGPKGISPLDPAPIGAVRAASPVLKSANGPVVLVGGDFCSVGRQQDACHYDWRGLNDLNGTAFLAWYRGCACYANCDGSTVEPVLNVLDFNCFLNRFTAGDYAYANCDQSTLPPLLNVLDFNCFLNRFAAGCP